MSSKFSNLLMQARNRPTDEEEPEAEQGSEQTASTKEAQQTPVVATNTAAPAKPKTRAQKATPQIRQPTAVVIPEPNITQPSVLGRPRTGKRSDPDYTQITAYIRKETHRDVKMALLQEGEGREISEVIEECLVSWLAQQK